MSSEKLQPATTYAIIVGNVIRYMRAYWAKHSRELTVGSDSFDSDVFARSVGISEATLSRIECGKSILTIERLDLIADMLGVAPSILLKWADGVSANLERDIIVVINRTIDKNKYVAVHADVVERAVADYMVVERAISGYMRKVML